MDSVTHVKPKSAWKKVALDPNFFAGIDFAGPTYIEVLEDYEISSFNNKSKSKKDLKKLKEEKQKQLKDKQKKKKNKLKSKAEKQDNESGTEVDLEKKSEKQTAKKKKKNKLKSKTEKQNNESGTEVNQEKKSEKQKVKQKKKNILKSKTEKQDNESGTEVDQEKKSEKQKVKKKKRRKRKKKNAKSDEEIDITEVKSGADVGAEKGPANKNQKRKHPNDDDGSSPKKMKKSLKNVADKKTSDVTKTKLEKENQVEQPEIEIDMEKFKNKPPGMDTWEGLFVPNEVLWALKEQDFTAPTPIQARILPSAIRDKMDVVGAAETGSGKTLAFGIPIIYHILQQKGNKSDDPKNSSDDDEDEEEDVIKSDSELEDEEETENKLTDITDKDDDKDIGSDDDENDIESDVEDGDIEIIEQDDEDCEAEEEDVEKVIEQDDEESEAENGDEDYDIERVMEDNTDTDEGEGSDVNDSEEEEIQDLPENKLGCVRVINNVDFSWIEEEDKKARASGKTHPIALILEPTRELAMQVKNHLNAVAKYTDVKVATIVGGMAVQKQRRVLKQCPQVIVATPGRLWDLMEEGVPYLSEIEKTGILVIDEADRMVEKGHFEELASLLRKMNRDPKICNRRRTYVFSATLTTIHEGPHRYDKRNKNKVQKMTETEKLDLLMQSIGMKTKPKVVDLTRKFGTVETLTEARIHCSNEEKDIYLYYFMKQYPGRTLVFCNSKDCIRRLVSVFTYLKCNPLPLHADMHQRQRLKNLDKFTSNAKGLLIASDVAARGLDIPNVQHVIHFQVPYAVENYIHRSGRTARAYKEGLSVMLIGPNDMKNYKKIINTLNRDEELPLFPVEPEYLTESRQRVDLVRKIETQEYRFQKGKRQNDWLKKMAEDSGIDIEDDGLFTDLGDEQKQANHKRGMKHMKMELDFLLKQPIVPRTMGGKYPTKMGKLSIPIVKSLESGGAIAHLKTDKKKQDKYIKKMKNNPVPDTQQKKKKDKWKKKKWQRMKVKKDDKPASNTASP